MGTVFTVRYVLQFRVSVQNKKKYLKWRPCLSVCLCLSDRPSNSYKTARRIFMKFDVGVL